MPHGWKENSRIRENPTAKLVDQITIENRRYFPPKDDAGLYLPFVENVEFPACRLVYAENLHIRKEALKHILGAVNVKAREKMYRYMVKIADYV